MYMICSECDYDKSLPREVTDQVTTIMIFNFIYAFFFNTYI